MSEEQQRDAALDNMVDGFFTAAKSQDLHPSDDLMARVLRDAEREQPAQMMPDFGKPGVLQQLWGALGGWPAMAGLATATIAGVWMGFYPGDYVSEIMGQYTGSDSDLYLVNSLSLYDFNLGEG